MTSRLPWFQFDADDWLDGTADLSLEAQGLYIRLLALMWKRKQRLPSDRKSLARLMMSDPRLVSRIMRELIEAGKVVDDGETVGNKRMDKHLAEMICRSEKATKRESTKAQLRLSYGVAKPLATAQPSLSKAASSGEIEKKQEVKKQVFEKSATDIDKEKDIDNNITGNRAALLPPAADLDTLSKRLIEAANGSIADPTTAAGLSMLSVPVGWLQSGADLEVDVIPTIKAVSKARHGKQINTWTYFSQAIADARDARINGLPPPKPRTSRKSKDDAPLQKTFADREAGLRTTYDMYCQRLLQGKPWPDHPDLPAPGKPGSEKFAEILKLHQLQVYSPEAAAPDWASTINDQLPT